MHAGKKIQLSGSETWVATDEMKLLGELVRMEIAKHIWSPAVQQDSVAPPKLQPRLNGNIR